jgi:hypothetical protein
VVEQVIQTATKVLDGGLTAREAVTVFATLTREAVPAAVAYARPIPIARLLTGS